MFLSSSRMRPADHAQIAMVSRIFLKDSGFVANAPSRQRTQWYVLTVRAVRTARCLAIQLTPQSCLFCPNGPLGPPPLRNLDSRARRGQRNLHGAGRGCGADSQKPMEAGELRPRSVRQSSARQSVLMSQICSICRERMGACIQCTNRNCFTAFHVTCARQMGLLMSMKSLGTEGQLIAYCEKHLPVSRHGPLQG
jgi:hypothetical protein